MSATLLSKALRALAAEIDSTENKRKNDDHAAELLRVLARIVEGKTIDRAFGAPGDWGYGTPIGDAVFARLSEPLQTHKLDTAEQVFFYEQDFYVLSNFSAFNLRWEGLVFPTSEHAYQWSKFWDVNSGQHTKKFILNAPSAHRAFKIAEEYKGERRDDWDRIKVSVMQNILRAKAKQHEYVRRKLLATGDRELIEDSWRDDFWGWGPNRDGQNMLGKLWMEIRAELRSTQTAGLQ